MTAESDSMTPETENRREQLAAEAFERIRSGQHWTDWRFICQGFEVGRNRAMREARTNEPVGRRYNEAFAKWMDAREWARSFDKMTRSHCLWCADHLTEIEAWREQLANSGLVHKLAQWNHPTTIKRHYEAAHRPPKPKVDKPEPEVPTEEAFERAQEHLGTAEQDAAGSDLGHWLHNADPWEMATEIAEAAYDKDKPVARRRLRAVVDHLQHYVLETEGGEAGEAADPKQRTGLELSAVLLAVENAIKAGMTPNHVLCAVHLGLTGEEIYGATWRLEAAPAGEATAAAPPEASQAPGAAPAASDGQQDASQEPAEQEPDDELRTWAKSMDADQLFMRVFATRFIKVKDTCEAKLDEFLAGGAPGPSLRKALEMVRSDLREGDPATYDSEEFRRLFAAAGRLNAWKSLTELADQAFGCSLASLCKKIDGGKLDRRNAKKLAATVALLRRYAENLRQLEADAAS